MTLCKKGISDRMTGRVVDDMWFNNLVDEGKEGSMTMRAFVMS